MGATSITGVGKGMSEGEYKSANNTGCCGKTDEKEETDSSPVKRGCSISIKSCCGKTIKSCCNARIRGC